MNQLVVIALGGACGAVLRFLVSTGLYSWLGRDFPYGTLAINVSGSFLMGLLSEALILQRIAIGVEYRAAILVGLLGAFTTFSTFSLETLLLIEQGNLGKAAMNTLANVGGCLLAVWLGLLLGRAVYRYSGGVIYWHGGTIPYSLMTVNVICAFLMGIVAAVLMQKVPLAAEFRATLIILMIGIYLTLSGLYLILFLLEQGITLSNPLLPGIFIGNSLLCLSIIWLSVYASKQL